MYRACWEFVIQSQTAAYFSNLQLLPCVAAWQYNTNYNMKSHAAPNKAKQQ